MPLHDFQCHAGHVTEQYVEHGVNAIFCECGRSAAKVFLRAPMGIVSDIRYQSPVDGRAITTKQARADDLARNNCVPYDPDMKQDYLRRQADSEAALERKADAIVEQEIHAMPSRKRELLDQEFRAGADVAIQRQTVEG